MKHTYSIKMHTTFWATVGIICFTSIPAMADEPTWWTQQKKDCGLSPDLAYDSWDGKCNSSTSTPGYNYKAARRAQSATARHKREREKKRLRK